MTLWFIHVPRTGGRSVLTYIRNNDINFRFVCDEHSKYSNSKKDALGPDVTSFTILRCPVEHTASLYSFIKKHKEHEYHEHTVGRSFSEWIRFRKDHISNYYYNFFGKENNDLAKIDKIINTKHLSKEFSEFINGFGCPQFSVHENNYAKPEISNEDVDFINKIRRKDYELLSKVKFKI